MSGGPDALTHPMNRVAPFFFLVVVACEELFVEIALRKQNYKSFFGGCFRFLVLLCVFRILTNIRLTTAAVLQPLKVEV